MAGDEVQHRHRGHRRTSTRTRKTSSKVSRNASTTTSDPTTERPADIDALRAARLQYLGTPAEERRKKMKYVGETVTRTATRQEDGQKEDRRARRKRSPRSTHGLRQRSVKTVEGDAENHSDEEYVYGRPAAGAAQDGGAKESGADAQTPKRSKTRRTTSSKVGGRSEVRQTPPRRHTEPAKRRNSYGMDDCQESPGETARSPVRDQPPAVRGALGPSLARSVTRKAQTNVSTADKTAPSDHSRKGSLFSGLFRPTPPPAEKKVSCLTCGSDVRISRTAKLGCSHRMCHTCLKRIFTMSVTDPAHMPPRCCTSNHIPLKHVDRLFDDAFKKNWNRKFQEYSTQNRIYCPSRGCGEWIKPNQITLDHGRKVGKCKRCGTKVCCTCNNKMHISRECPKDPETKRFVEIAKEKGWQRCYNCCAMVELKEGCNHMTCRCTAEFCMVCGLKWKSCDCPWFNYEQVDAHLGNPARYQEELDRRRDQEHRDEEIARRMEVLGLDEPDTFGVGNGAGHHMNANFIQQAREALTANYAHAEQAARGLLNGLMTGRENRLPGLPLPADQTARQLRQATNARDPAEENADGPPPAQGPARRVARRTTARRPSGFADWTTGVPAPP